MHKILFYNKFISCLYMFRAHVLIVRRSKLYYTAYRFDDTRSCVMQFWLPDDEHICSKHVEAWNKLTVKQKCCASSWLITETKKNCKLCDSVFFIIVITLQIKSRNNIFFNLCTIVCLWVGDVSKSIIVLGVSKRISELYVREVLNDVAV